MSAVPALPSVAAAGIVVGLTLNLVLYTGDRDWTPRRGSWPRYLLVEALTTGLFLALALRFGITAQLPAYLYLAAVGVLVAMLDFHVRRLPDVVILPSYIVTVLLLLPAGAAEGDWAPAQRALGGMAALGVMCFALAIAYPHVVRFSDGKLAGLLGLQLAWVSLGTELVGALGCFLVAGVGGVAYAGHRRVDRSQVPFAALLIFASVLALFVAVPIGRWYGSVLA